MGGCADLVCTPSAKEVVRSCELLRIVHIGMPVPPRDAHAITSDMNEIPFMGRIILEVVYFPGSTSGGCRLPASVIARIVARP